MKAKRIVVLLITLILALMPISKVKASAQDFYISDFTADYYLTKKEDNTSKLHVKETITAFFPETDQNHGINREIPKYNQGMKNLTIKTKAALNLTVLRNGLPEKISKIDDEGYYYNVYIGDANEYVHGAQVYTLEYDFTDVITEFDGDGQNVSGKEGATKLFQELYWDTNGTNWRQNFDKVTARLHLPAKVLEKTWPETWCYVGKYGESIEGKCVFEKTDDGFIYETEDLNVGENLTFDVRFDPDTFNVILDKSYLLFVFLLIEIVILTFVLIKNYRRWKKEASEKRKLYRSTFVTPQYQPPKNKAIHVAEGEQVYLDKTKPSYVATLLELAVAKAITITKKQNEKKPKKLDWTIHVDVEPETLSLSQISMLKILANKSTVSKDEDIVIKKHTATRTLANYAKNYKTDAEDILNKEGYLIKKKISGNDSGVISTIIAKLFIYVIVLVVAAVIFESVFWSLIGGADVIVGGKYLPFVMIGIFVIAVVINTIISKQTEKFAKYTDKGIELVKYLEGLELYINMAEKDRLEFLQSVKGADTSNAGIVKLYEKLLPWASLFGSEKSWMKELAKYYEIGDVEEGIDINLLDSIIASNIVRDVNTVVAASTTYHEPSGGSGSSFSSGGGGGGFSGGGGGGGGGGGW